MPVHLIRPVTVMAGRKVTTEETCAEVSARMPEHPRLGALLRSMSGCGVATRYFSRPFAEVIQDGGVAQRNRTAFANARGMALDAAGRALEAASLAPGDIDAIVTSHTTSTTVTCVVRRTRHQVRFLYLP